MHPTMRMIFSYNNNINLYHFLYQMNWNIEWRLCSKKRNENLFLLERERLFIVPCSVNPILKSKIRSINFANAIFDVKEHTHILLRFFRRLRRYVLFCWYLTTIIISSPSFLLALLSFSSRYFSTHFHSLVSFFFCGSSSSSSRR
jgi:hypothetical protein